MDSFDSSAFPQIHRLSRSTWPMRIPVGQLSVQREKTLRSSAERMPDRQFPPLAGSRM